MLLLLHQVGKTVELDWPLQAFPGARCSPNHAWSPIQYNKRTRACFWLGSENPLDWIGLSRRSLAPTAAQTIPCPSIQYNERARAACAHRERLLPGQVCRPSASPGVPWRCCTMVPMPSGPCLDRLAVPRRPSTCTGHQCPRASHERTRRTIIYACMHFQTLWWPLGGVVQ